eukprot:scaffold114266_cov55-Phaeocystis_antarctica.AAC.5
MSPLQRASLSSSGLVATSQPKQSFSLYTAKSTGSRRDWPCVGWGGRTRQRLDSATKQGRTNVRERRAEEWGGAESSGAEPVAPPAGS